MTCPICNGTGILNWISVLWLLGAFAVGSLIGNLIAPYIRRAIGRKHEVPGKY